jgi:hypothetical protein
MKHIILLPIFMVLFFVYSTKGMQKEIHFKDQLTEIEKSIVLFKMKHASHKLDFHTTNNDTKEKLTSISIVTIVKKDRTDDFATSIIEAITEQEKKVGYVPEQISEKKDGVWHITLPNNYIGNYTRYYHTKDDAGEYIELHSTFTYQPAVIEVLNDYAS